MSGASNSGSQTIRSYVYKQQAFYIDARVKTASSPKTQTLVALIGKRKAGVVWVDNIKIGLTQDRGRWRDLLNAVMSLRLQ
jgi:hypothetical protein